MVPEEHDKQHRQHRTQVEMIFNILFIVTHVGFRI